MSEKFHPVNHEEPAERVADRFQVNPADYPLFQDQYELDMRWGNDTHHYWNIDHTLSTFVTQTADLICRFDGTSQEYEDEEDIAPPDHIIYLDKSARPVSWLVNTFWDDFSEAKRPEHSYLSIDRISWFRRSGAQIDANGYTVAPDGSPRLATIRDFHPENLPEDDFARLRGLYLAGGISETDPTKIMRTPSLLDGKHIMIVDEVARSGSTLGIAADLLRQAFPEAASIRGAYFWKGDSKSHDGESQILSVPVWYDQYSSYGRGIGEVDPPFFEARYHEHPSDKARAQHYGSLFLASYNNLSTEPGQRSRELMREIKQMRRDFDAGKILLRIPSHYTEDREDAVIEAQGLRLAPADNPAPDSYINVVKAIQARPPKK